MVALRRALLAATAIVLVVLLTRPAERAPSRAERAGTSPVPTAPAGGADAADAEPGPPRPDADAAGGSPPPGIVAGRVVDPAGRPLSGVAVTGAFVADERALGALDPVPLATTGRDGGFRIEGAEGWFRLAPTAPGRVPVGVARGRTGPGHPVPPLHLVSAATRTLRGRLVDRNGHPLAGEYVALDVPRPGHAGRTTDPSRIAAEGWGMRTGAEGAFVFPDVPDLPLELSCFPSRHAPLERVVPAGATRFDLHAGPAHAEAALHGRVAAADGTPLAGAQVDAHTCVEQRSARTGPDGRYRLVLSRPRDPIYDDPGRLRVLVTADGHAPALLRDRRLRAGEQALDANLTRGHAIAGRVVAASGAPVAGARLWLSGGPDVTPAGPRRFSPADLPRSDAAGRFRFDHLLPGVYRVTAREGGRLGAVAASAGASGVEIRLGDAADALVFWVLDVRAAESGDPIGRVRVTVRNESGGATTPLHTPGGRGTCGPRPPGRWSLSVSAEGRARVHLTLRAWSAGRHPLTFALPRAAPLEVRVLDAEGAPVVGARLVPRSAEGEPIPFDDTDPGRASNTRPRTGLTGRFSFFRLPRRPLLLEVVLPGAERGPRFAVEPGATGRAVLRLP